MPGVNSRKRPWVGRALVGLVVLTLGATLVALRNPSEPAAPPDPGPPANSNPPPGPVAAADPGPPPARPPRPADAGAAVVRAHQPTAVAANRTADVPDGFRGDVHPLLSGRAPLEVTAHWAGLDRSQLRFDAPEEVKAWYAGLRPALPRVGYTPRDFSAFLPQSVTRVGQLWALDPDKLKTILGQFHPNPSLHLVATGRRAGPDGAFAVLRAVSPTHLDVAFRVHAEFLITPPAGPLRAVQAWLTPASFHGRLLVNKGTGSVEHFRLALPTEKSLNAFLTVDPSRLGVPRLGHDILRIDRMELSGGDGRLADNVAWAEAIPPAEADRRLARVFYKFEEIDWVPPDQALARARDKNRPIFAIVSWGATDDQSC